MRGLKTRSKQDTVTNLALKYNGKQKEVGKHCRVASTAFFSTAPTLLSEINMRTFFVEA